MKIKTSKLTGPALDWAVAKCLGYLDNGVHYPSWVYHMRYYPSTDWSQGGPILTREGISRTIDHSGLWIAYWTDGYTCGDEGKKWMQCDRSELVAGLRCYIASKLGEEVDVPEELT